MLKINQWDLKFAVEHSDFPEICERKGIGHPDTVYRVLIPRAWHSLPRVSAILGPTAPSMPLPSM